jgi:hypothetical protein
LLGREDIHPAIIQNIPTLHGMALFSLSSGQLLPRKKQKRQTYEGDRSTAFNCLTALNACIRL